MKQPHTFIKTGDPDSHHAIEDGHGEVALNECRVCGQAEGDLEEFCPGPKVENATPTTRPN